MNSKDFSRKIVDALKSCAFFWIIYTYITLIFLILHVPNFLYIFTIFPENSSLSIAKSFTYLISIFVIFIVCDINYSEFITFSLETFTKISLNEEGNILFYFYLNWEDVTMVTSLYSVDFLMKKRIPQNHLNVIRSRCKSSVNYKGLFTICNLLYICM